MVFEMGIDSSLLSLKFLFRTLYVDSLMWFTFSYQIIVAVLRNSVLLLSFI